MSDGISVEEMGLSPKDLGITINETPISGEKLKQSLIEKIGFIPTSTAETSRILRGVFDRDEPDQIAKTGYGFDRIGFNGNGVTLGFDENKSLEEIDLTHRGSHIVEFFAIPNIRKEIIQILNGKRPPFGFVETLFARELNPSEVVGSSGINPNPELVLDSQFFEGYFDKKTNEWVPNPNFWENKLKAQGKQAGWNEEQYQRVRATKYEEIKTSARQKLASEIKKIEQI